MTAAVCAACPGATGDFIPTIQLSGACRSSPMAARLRLREQHQSKGLRPLHPLACASCRVCGKVWKTGGGPTYNLSTACGRRFPTLYRRPLEFDSGTILARSARSGSSNSTAFTGPTCGSWRACGKAWKTGGKRRTGSAPPEAAGFPCFTAAPWNSPREPFSRAAPTQARRIPQLPQAAASYIFSFRREKSEAPSRAIARA
jgi:hypothetical protein